MKVNTVFVKDGLIERVKTEGDKSPADILMTVDIGNLLDLVEAGITQPIESTTLDGAIPAKTKQLIAVAVAHSTQCPYCIRGHTKAAMQQGATPEEIRRQIAQNESLISQPGPAAATTSPNTTPR